jgi:hypothetical protein
VTLAWRRARAGARNSVPSVLAEPTSRAFALRFAVLAVLILLVPWAISLLHLDGWLRFLPPASVAIMLAVAYIWWPVEALLGFVVFVALYDSIAVHIGSTKQVDELTVAVLAPIAFLRARREWRLWTWWPREAALAVFFASVIASTLVADVPLRTALPGLILVSKAIVFFYIVTWTPFPTWALRGALQVGLAVGLAIMTLGLVEYLNPPVFQSVLGLPEYARSRGEGAVVKSLFGHPAQFGFFTTTVALFAYAQYLITKRWRWLGVALFMTLGPFLSARRRAILAMLAGLAAAFIESLRSVRDPRSIARTWLPVLGGLILMGAFFQSGLASLYQSTIVNYVGRGVVGAEDIYGDRIIGEGENPQARLALYQGALWVAEDQFPLGGGLGRFGTWMSREHYSPLYYQYNLDSVPGLKPRRPAAVTDTFWPAILGESGVIGLLGYVVFLATLLIMLWREAGRDDGPLLRLVRLAAGMVFAQAIVESLASSMFHSPPRVYLFYLVIGVVAALAWRRRASEPQRADVPAGQ